MYKEEDLNKLKKVELQDILTKLEIKYTSSMTKAVLIEKILTVNPEENISEIKSEEKVITKDNNKEEITASASNQVNQNNTINQNYQNNENIQKPDLSLINPKYDGKKPDGLGIAGGILSIIGGVFWCLTLIGLIIGIPVIVTNSNYLKGKNNKVSAGVWGIFGSLIGGILVLVSTRDFPKN